MIINVLITVDITNMEIKKLENVLLVDLNVLNVTMMVNVTLVKMDSY